jgi:hypothetical protein
VIFPRRHAEISRSNPRSPVSRTSRMLRRSPVVCAMCLRLHATWNEGENGGFRTKFPFYTRKSNSRFLESSCSRIQESNHVHGWHPGNHNISSPFLNDEDNRNFMVLDGVVFRHLRSQFQVSENEFQDPGILHSIT